ncbi:hypothetical protein PQQ51_31835 [Paraburkholderia xenovorans]|uniref:hypothetical protein n=1 Tax=Paraburkholderia xenovorans TaxID=36873 RepID=UPI0038B9DA6E
MLARAIPERALGALFGGERAASALYAYVAQLQRSHAASKEPPNTTLLRKNLQAAIELDIDERTARRHRSNETAQVAKEFCDAPFLDSANIPAFAAITNAVLQSGSAPPCFRDEQVHRYAELLSEVDPTILVAWHLVDEMAKSGNAATLEAAIAGLSTLFVGQRFAANQFAEGHVHLGGIPSNELALAQVVLGPQLSSHQQTVGTENEQRLRHHRLSRLRRIRRILMVFTSNWSSASSGSAYSTRRQEAALLEACIDDAHLAAPEPALDWHFVARGIVVKNQATGQTVPGEKVPLGALAKEDIPRGMLAHLADAAAHDDYEPAWTWLFISLWCAYRAPRVTIATRAVVLLLVAEIMALRREMIMDSHGLRRFTTKFFHAPLRSDATTHASWLAISSRQAARQLFAKTGDKAEIKICASSLNDADAAAGFARKAFERISSLCAAGTSSGSASHDYSRAHWHFCAHFNRSTKANRRKLWEHADHLNKVLQTVNPWVLAPGTGQDAQSEARVQPAELIRGLDVVGDETRQPIEMFAPMLRWLRSSTNAQGSSVAPGSPFPGTAARLHLSIHAGEDYAHPLSGLRHIDETVRFCEMRAGDRLGHALALGIPPEEWLRRHGDVLLSVDDHFDNLVWAWHEATALSGLNSAEATVVLPRLTQRIERMLQHVSWLPAQAGGRTLASGDLPRFYEAWRLRKNCAHSVLDQVGNMQLVTSKLQIAAPDLQEITGQIPKPTTATAAGLYVLRARSTAQPRQVRLTWLRHGHATRAQQQREAPGYNSHDRHLHDHDDAADLRFMLAVQDACMERYRKLELSIEANPTSNVYIGQLEAHGDHPLFRWHPPDASDLAVGGRFNQFGLRHATEPLPVTINTDDPGMTPTTLRLEHHLMHEAALDRGYDLKLADDWIHALRKRGTALFDQAH